MSKHRPSKSHRPLSALSSSQSHRTASALQLRPATPNRPGCRSAAIPRTYHRHPKPPRQVSIMQEMAAAVPSPPVAVSSGDCCLFFIATTEARVSLAATAGEGPGLPGLGKHRGSAQDHGLQHTMQRTFSEKRAYRRARNRALQSLEGGTTYKGRWCTRAALQAFKGCPNSCHPHPKVVSQQRITRPSRQARIRCLSWNTSGLSSALFQEFTAWLDIENCCDIVVLQETHWDRCSDFYSGNWACLHSSGHHTGVSYDKHGGILIMANKKSVR